MIQRIKIALPYYYIVMSVFFSVCIVLIRKVNTWNSIGAILDNAISILSIVIFSNTYYIENQLNTIDVYCLTPLSKRKEDVIKRILIKILFLFLLFLLTYSAFLIRKPIVYIGESKIQIFINALFAVGSSIIFWGGLSCVLVNILNNIWIGLGGSIIFWITMSSTIARKFPVYLDVFRYGSLDGSGIQLTGWQIGKIFSLVAGIIFIVINTCLIKRSPYK
ncbi:MAG TPA: hypothetical protein DCE48_17160 [Lachnospiraceae bacterium]|nr:hypothetical protein [Lachnospiraceae bacterium]